MNRVKPKQKNKLHIPVNIYKGEKLVKEAESIQEAARWLKQDTEDRFKRFSVITKGIWYYAHYSYNGYTYYFETDPAAVALYFERINRKILTRIQSDEALNNLGRYKTWKAEPNLLEHTNKEVSFLFHI
ncbi:hypothetical protein KUV80_11065 [Fictibacillus nanhaiensis]|uniref:hypothetical protein n=1 Tax=Fictibacillus nanhaiensis TaxID=742169 RepID=UPI001C96AC45|nr:hypothetical protein [Fictibacillus nanhaiensis]MBY6037199.1 hypothetical protein [Fictibacillus nanhaiensis]